MKLDRFSVAVGIVMALFFIGCMTAVTSDPGTSRRYQFIPRYTNGGGGYDDFSILDQDTGTLNVTNSGQTKVYTFLPQ